MKKFLTTLAIMACMATAMTGCEDNSDNPKAQIPVDNNFLNTPPTANFHYDLKATETVTITCSQPDYGLATIPQYAVQLSLDPQFKGVPAEWTYNSPDATPQNFIELPSSTSNTTINIASRDLADAINACRGFNALDQLETADYSDFNGKVYLRVRAFFASAPEEIAAPYTILSNIICLSSVKAFPTLRQPGYIYLVGAPEGWVGPEAGNALHYENWKLFEPDDKIGSKVYSATFDIAAGQFQFRFYSALEGWDVNSIGSQNEDNPVDIALNADGVYTGPCKVGKEKGEGKGSWQIPGWEGGRVTITVNLNASTVEFKKVS